MNALNPANPASPISPLNPISPVNPIVQSNILNSVSKSDIAVPDWLFFTLIGVIGAALFGLIAFTAYTIWKNREA